MIVNVITINFIRADLDGKCQTKGKGYLKVLKYLFSILKSVTANYFT